MIFDEAHKEAETNNHHEIDAEESHRTLMVQRIGSRGSLITHEANIQQKYYDLEDQQSCSEIFQTFYGLVAMFYSAVH